MHKRLKLGNSSCPLSPLSFLHFLFRVYSNVVVVISELKLEISAIKTRFVNTTVYEKIVRLPSRGTTPHRRHIPRLRV